MLLVHFDQNPKFLSGRQRTKTEFKENHITLQLATDQGNLPLDEHMIGEWNLTAEQDLRVSVSISFANY